MPEWIIERGIGETRAALIEGGEILASRVLLDGILPAGSVVDGRLTSVGVGGRNAGATLEDGTELLLPVRPPGISEGAGIRLEITRERIPGTEPWKRPLARPTEAPPAIAPLPGRPAAPGELDAHGWADLIEAAQSGTIAFAGGELRLFATPAMTLIDVDGSLPPAELAVLGAKAAGQAIRRLGIGGSVGIDLPTAAGREARQRAAAALDAALGGERFERTAVNGFGFLQLVRPRRHASLLELAADRAPFAARALLRGAEVGHGPCELTAAPSVIAVLEGQPQWIEALAGRRGGPVTLRPDPRLATSSFHVQG